MDVWILTTTGYDGLPVLKTWNTGWATALPVFTSQGQCEAFRDAHLPEAKVEAIDTQGKAYTLGNLLQCQGVPFVFADPIPGKNQRCPLVPSQDLVSMLLQTLPDDRPNRQMSPGELRRLLGG